MSSVAKRYAKALFALGAESGEMEAFGRELHRAAEAFAAPTLRAFVDDVTLDRKTRRIVAERVSEKLGVSRLFANFLALLGENNRLRDLPAIRDHYQRLEDRALGRVRARVRSAQPLSEESRERILKVFERLTGKSVLAEAVVAPELLGGTLVQIQGKVFDGSLRTQLERLKQSLAG